MFLKYDPSDVIVTLGGLIWGPMTSCIVSVIVATIEMITVSDTGILEQVTTDRLSARKFWGLKQTNCALYVDVKRHCVMIGEQEVYLSANEFEVFYMLYLSPQITFTKEQIYEKIWHEPTNNHLHAVENTVFQIRKRLKPHCKGHEYIKTVVGYGYKFNSD